MEARTEATGVRGTSAERWSAAPLSRPSLMPQLQRLKKGQGGGRGQGGRLSSAGVWGKLPLP